MSYESLCCVHRSIRPQMTHAEIALRLAPSAHCQRKLCLNALTTFLAPAGFMKMAGVPLEGVELPQPAAAGGHNLLPVLLHADRSTLACAGHHSILARSEESLAL